MILPVLPIKNSVLFPSVSTPFNVGRPASIAAIEAALSSEDRSLVIVAQRRAEIDDPGSEDLYTVGTRSVVKRLHRSGNERHLVIQGLERVTITEFLHQKPFIRARTEPRPMGKGVPEVTEALREELLARLNEMQEMIQVTTPRIAELVAQIADPIAQVYLLASLFQMPVEKSQAILEADSPSDALRVMHEYLAQEEKIVKLRRKISETAATEMSKEQREYLLRQQLHAIQQELGEQKPEEAEVNLLRERLAKADLPENVKTEAEAELERLAKLPNLAPDYQVTRSHLELILELPWSKATTDNLDLARARKVLDDDHYDLKEVKDRILEHLAVLKLNPKAKAPILCFVGPPGTGKTSLGQSIARALERKFERMSLGGMHDEAELRGHRRTYVGALPGRLIQAIRRAGANNPLLMLDEVDKLGRDFRGDPAAALMEVLDPAQNFSFRDNYLDLPFDLSKVFFITTANTLDSVPSPLLDRMEVLRLAGYTEEEKIQISRRYLEPRQLTEAGLKPEQLGFELPALQRIIRRYTREAGLRQLERTLGSLARKIAMRFAEGRAEAVSIREADLNDLLGPESYFSEEARQRLSPGVAAGLAWTEAGGEVIYIEAAFLPNRQGLIMTGHLGEVMKESVQTALGYVWSRQEAGPGARRHGKAGVHVHVPAGAVPKDGPSAGVAILVAAASLYSGIPVRGDTAMTGEVTLTGLVLPVGGIKEKTLAARRADLRRVILPKDNQKDLSELPPELRSSLEFIFVENAEQALAAALPVPTPVPAMESSKG